jgi:cation diffusion facilitator family transporter
MKKEKEMNKVITISLFTNIILSIAKTAAGILGKSNALLADGVHSISDVLTTLVAFVGIRVSNKPPDSGHMYGHTKYEAVASKIIAIFLVITALGITYSAWQQFIDGNISKPDTIALYAAILSIIVKELLFRYVLRIGKKHNSLALISDAWHNRSDALSSIGASIGIFVSRLGYLWADPLASTIVALIILRVGVKIYIDSIDQLVDSSPDKETMSKINQAICSVDGVIEIDEIKARMVGPNIHLDLKIAVNPYITVKKGHDIAVDVEERIRNSVGNCQDIMVHINPKL